MNAKGQISTTQSDDQLLERRRRPGQPNIAGSKVTGSKTEAKNDQVIGGLEAFKHVLEKHALRYAKHGTPYMLASLTILEWTEVAKTFGESASKQLLRMVQEVILKNMRLSDRLCFYGSGKFVVLLTDCNQKTAKQIVERICLAVGTAKTQYHKTSLRASLSYNLAGADSGHTNIEAMISSTIPSIEIAESGGSVEPASQFVDQSVNPSVTLSANDELYASWLCRYDKLEACDWFSANEAIVCEQFQAEDKWTKAKKVLICSINLAKSAITLNTSDYQEIASRASFLQQIDHPGLLRLDDFFVGDQFALKLVYDFPSGERLDKFLAKPAFCNKNPHDLILGFAEQICSALIVLHKQFPRPFSLRLETKSFCLSKNFELVLSDYVWPCLAKAEIDSALTIQTFGQLMLDVLHKFHVEIPEYKEDQLRKFFGKLTQNAVPKDLNNFYKIRAGLMRIAGDHARF